MTDRCLLAQVIYVTNPDSFRPGFDIWLAKNWAIYLKFETIAQDVWRVGRRHYSARTIMEVIRHHTTLSDLEDEFKINDWWTPSCARLYLAFHPEHAGLFELRGLNRVPPVPLDATGAVAVQINQQRVA